MTHLESISFSRKDEVISAVVLDSSFTGYEFVYEETMDRITEVYSIDATGAKPVYSVLSLFDVPTHLTIKVKKFIELNYNLK